MRNKRFAAVIPLLFLLLSWNVFCQYAPAPGAEDVSDLYSPILLAEGSPATLGEGPQADAVNPAMSGLVQRTTLDVSYAALTGFGDPAAGPGLGHVVNLGFVSPTRAAVFSTSAHLITSRLTGMPLGTAFLLHGSAAKELYPGWLVGAGFRAAVGRAQEFDIGAGLDLGMVRMAGVVGPFEDFRWGVALQNIGKWYDPFTAYGAMPSPFTPVGGVTFTALSNSWVRLQTSGTLSAPGFRNLRAGVSARATFFDAVSLHAGLRLDLRQLIDPAVPDVRSFIPSFGLTATVRTGLGKEGFAAERGWTETELKTRVSAAPLYNGIWAISGGVNAPLGIIDTQGPEVAIDYTGVEHISPNNDGTSDALTVPVSVTDARYVMSWQFEIRNADGGVVRTIRNKDERPENKGFQSVVDNLLEVRTGIAIPETIRWDGYTDGGDVAPDGPYSFALSATDDNGNVGVSPPYEVIVDTTAPELRMEVAEAGNRIFSPNGDGNKDVFVIGQSGSREELWEAEVVNALGVPVRTYTWRGSAPDAVVWDGRSDSAEAVPDGVYRYRISSVDPAGNDTRAEVANIIVNTEATPVGLEISSSYFSPNGDGVLDAVDLQPVVPNTSGITEWTLVVRDAAGSVVRSFSDTQVAPRTIMFDGVTDSRTVVAEGSYHAELTVRYASGNAPSARSPDFVVDLTPPVVAVTSDVSLFSPNGDGNLETVSFFQETSREQRWEGTVRNDAGLVVRTIVWPNIADQRFTWNGRQDDGRLASDGTYEYTLASTDRAGNRSVSGPVRVTIDTSDAEIAVRAEFDAFSPNADSVRDRQRLYLRVDRDEDVANYRVDVWNEAGETVRTIEGINAVQPSVTWDGTLASGRRAPDGVYGASLDVRFVNGVEISARSAEFIMDTTPPSVSLTVPWLLFSPDGDGQRESVRIAQSSSTEESWTAAIRNAAGVIVREFYWTGRVEDLEWDGRDGAGNVVADGRYDYEITSTDRAGNTVVEAVSGLTVDTRQPRLFVTSSASAFSPNGDGIRDAMSFDLYANLLDGATQWRLTIRTDTGLVVREFSGTDVLATRNIPWDGRDGRDRLREGVFTAEYSVDYEKGNRPSATTGTVRVDVSAPQVTLNLGPLPFSPDNDGVDDELEIAIGVTDASPIAAWRLEILDRNRRFFNEFSGRGAPAAQLIWDGRAADGELVISAEDYPYVLTVSDELGNTTAREGLIPVDILVIRDGDRLKVQIASITFAPNSPELIVDPNDERGAKNRAILLRLAEIFEKYSSYSIRIEGHAVNVTGTEREEREELQPLSLARAQSVKDAMVSLGISERRITVVGRGGTEPIVPHTDLDNRWKNRRVEFVLIR